ncbi:MAG: fibrillin [Euryarchaeota archaeon]|mgnify:FL=1|nr:fibrillin [Euryarchaeota archaeon]
MLWPPESKSSEVKIRSHDKGEHMAKKRRLSWAVMVDGRSIWTLNAVPKHSQYGESLRKFRGEEYRRWDPTRSKLGAGLSRSRQSQYELLPNEGDTCLYLGAGHGTSISHLHDHVCGANNEKGGRIIAVDLSPRCLRDLVHLSTLRPGLVPVLGDARKHSAWGIMVANKVDWLLQDVSQAGQAEIFIKAVKRFLKPGGKGLLSLKAASERFSEGGERQVFGQVREQLESAGLTIEEQIDLHGLEDNHCLYFVTN